MKHLFGVLLAELAAFVVVTAVADEPQPLIFPPTSGEHLVLPDRVIDGDTIRFFYLIEGTARLYGINAPEMRGEDAKAGKKAKAHLATVLPDVPVKAAFKGRDKYGRALFELFTADGESISKIMVDSGNAKPYFGIGKPP